MSDYGRIGDYIGPVAAKKLSAVDIDTNSSNQHEFGGNDALRRLLGTGEDRRASQGHGIPTALMYLSDDDAPAVADLETTWYDARRNKPNRSAEWRLYYKDCEPIRMARPGDLKPDYAALVNMLEGQVIRLGAGIGVVNSLDPGDLHHALQRLEGKARKDLTDYYNDTRAALMEVLLTIMRTGRENDDGGGARGVTARESDILSVAVRVLHDRHGDDPQPPVIADLRDLLREGPDEVRTAAVWDDPGNDELYRAQVRGLLADLHGFSNKMTKFGRLFGDQTTARIDLSRPVDFDISALAQSGDDVVAAVLATTWTSAFAAKNAADVLAEEGLQPRRNHVIIMDEMHRALRASPLMVEKLDLLTRLNRQWGVGQIMITHTFKDLMCMETPAQNTKARGFVERREIKVLGALSRIEMDRYLRGECGLPVFRREEDMLEDWATPVNFGSDASHKGLGRFLIKLGGLLGIPINVEMCPLEKSGFNDTNLKWHA